jgi:hypothetical protein
LKNSFDLFLSLNSVVEFPGAGLGRLITINMAIRVVEFSNGGYKIRKIFA